MAIIERYDGRSFGFASRNFYAHFLAARRIAGDYRGHFGALRLNAPQPVHIGPFPFYADSRDELRQRGIDREAFAALNPSLRGAVLRSDGRRTPAERRGPLRHPPRPDSWT